MFPLGSSDPEGNTFFEDRPLSSVSGMTLNTTGRYASLKVRITFLGGIMNAINFIKQYKYAILVGLLVFAPTSAVVFGLFGFISGFLNWGILILIALIFIGLQGYDMFRNWMSNNDEEEYDFFN
jgi:hypothetical protein